MRKSVLIEEKIARGSLWMSVLITLGILFVILFHIISEGIFYVSWEFLTEMPREMGKEGGVLPSIIGTVYLVAVALGVATPIGVMAGIYLTEYTRKGKFVSTIRFFTETLAGIPSIVFGLFGFLFFVIFLGWGWSILSGGLTVAFMILPTIVRTTEEAIKSVPHSYREGSLALGATKWQTIYKIVLPSALPGIVTGIILGMGRVVGETAAVYLTAGTSGFMIPTSIWDPTRTLAVHLFVLASEGISFEKAYATATVLVVLIFIINFIANKLMTLMVRKRQGAEA
ncbi:MAG: phosphate ABC transporter permease PstA [Desulfotomaculum sp.]|nr:phosphate ABC transporter permease PstA [Desulfotomaculum sp.]